MRKVKKFVKKIVKNLPLRIVLKKMEALYIKKKEKKSKRRKRLKKNVAMKLVHG